MYFKTIILSLLISIPSIAATFDRLDGYGPSKVRVDVIEWEDNLEIHVYPKGSLNQLGAKLDKDKSVMVLSYSFKNKTKTLVRRAILGIPFSESFNGFYDSSEKEFDKIIISNKKEALPRYSLGVPSSLYPDLTDD